MTTVGELGEQVLLRRILAILGRGSAAAEAEAPVFAGRYVGPGDDCAVVPLHGDLAITTDTIVDGPDFRPEWSSPHDLGVKAIASNLADVASMGAHPVGLVVALVLPLDAPATWVDGFAAGLVDGLARMSPGTRVVGGDLSTGVTTTIAVTAFGTSGTRAPVLRSGALPGDRIAVSGPIGLSGAGMHALFARATTPAGEADRDAALALRARSPELEAAIGWHVAPMPDIGAGERSAAAGAHAMMDVSDGLTLDAARLAAASGVRIDFDGAALRHVATRLEPALALVHPGLDAASLARLALGVVLGGGEDHGFLAAFDDRAEIPQGFQQVGRVLPPHAAAPHAALTLDGEPIAPRGWDPFAFMRELDRPRQ